MNMTSVIEHLVILILINFLLSDLEQPKLYCVILIGGVTGHPSDCLSRVCPQVSRMSCSITELQTLLRHKDDSSRAYKERTDTQVSKQPH